MAKLFATAMEAAPDPATASATFAIIEVSFAPANKSPAILSDVLEAPVMLAIVFVETLFAPRKSATPTAPEPATPIAPAKIFDIF